MDWPSAVFGAFMCLCAFVFLNDCALLAVLRRRFFFWHAVRTLLIATMAICATDISMPVLLDDESNRMTILMITGALSLATLALFVLHFLEEQHTAGRIGQMLHVSALAAVVASALAPVTGVSPWLNSAFNISAGVSISLIFAMLVTALVQGSLYARYLLIALALGFMVGVAVLGYGILFDAILPNILWLIMPALALEFFVTIVAMAKRFMVINQEREAAFAEVRRALEANRTDPLTGLPNRRALEALFMSDAKTTPSGIALIDLDHFKSINDCFGHGIGDAVLTAVGEALVQDDVFAARLGGEEFLLVLYGKDWAKQAERARRRIPMTVREQVPDMLQMVTASAGLASFSAGDNLSEAMKRADLALYAAKQAGRNQSLALTFFNDRQPEWPAMPVQSAA